MEDPQNLGRSPVFRRRPGPYGIRLLTEIENHHHDHYGRISHGHFSRVHSVTSNSGQRCLRFEFSSSSHLT
ncbi:hypothetical protein DENSPDRAFT_831681 [Dentipellis sp. KUC8613]|nr:hypothetical protein DENSPDRAFT_831681 [Dentipellis sp. KUC8613]